MVFFSLKTGKGVGIFKAYGGGAVCIMGGRKGDEPPLWRLLGLIPSLANKNEQPRLKVFMAYGEGGGPGMALDIREEEGGAFLFCLQAFFSTL